MTDLRIMHISDIHFASENVGRPSPHEALVAAARAVRRDYGDSEIVLLVSGDVTTGGNPHGYTEAIRAFRTAEELMNVKKILVCPGNHDIERVKSDEFIAFNQFAFTLTGDAQQCWNRKHPVRVVQHEQYDFVLANTSYHGDYRTGKVPLGELEQALAKDSDRPKIVTIHHSPISSAYGGGGLEEAYDLLSLVSRHSAAALLHGHVHSDQAITVGKAQTFLSGVGSLGFQPDPNMNNQFAIYDFCGAEIRSMFTYYYRLNKNEFFGEEVELWQSPQS